ncbi:MULTISPECIES: transporter substrate-binding domain-containing protein [Rhodomicrobium]|uniref:transporter substrate-binding domain-containing protein n=1 Tax=Rhodomicrobium TaxID=1068 RepID=UPI000B4BE9BD|nr:MULTISPECIES: transporter substrate-binding domain-containing protein [Rhodomicrobium]
MRGNGSSATLPRLLAGMLIGWMAALAAAQAQVSLQPTVTIYTDGIARPDGRISKALTELVRTLGSNKAVRPLPVMGYGGVANVNDLLHSRDVEFAILNSDILAFLDLQKLHPDARRKIRFVTRLYSQKAYLLARREIAALDQLQGRTLGLVGPDSSTEVTARTLFSLAGVKPDIRRIGAGADAIAASGAYALFLLESDLASLPAETLRSGAFHVIEIPVSEKLAAVYHAATIAPGEAGSERPAATIAVDTLMAVFDWAPVNPRYADVSRFIGLFFDSLPKLREDFPASIWNETDPHAPVAGWDRYRHAQKIMASVPRVVPLPVAGAQARLTVPFSTQTEAAADPALADAATRTDGLSLSVVASPPLTDPSAPGGGLITELAMAAAKRVYGGEVAVVWANDKPGQIEDMVKTPSPTIAVPWQTPNCDEPQFLGAQSAAVCDGMLVSAPLFQVPIVFFARAGGDFRFDTDDSVGGRIICLPAGRDVADLGEAERKWVENNKLTLRRPATMIDCLSMVERGEADALAGSEPETRFMIERLGLSAGFKMADRPLASRGIHIVIAKAQREADALLAKINAAIAVLKQSSEYAAIVNRHLAAFMPGAVAKAE